MFASEYTFYVPRKYRRLLSFIVTGSATEYGPVLDGRRLVTYEVCYPYHPVILAIRLSFWFRETFVPRFKQILRELTKKDRTSSNNKEDLYDRKRGKEEIEAGIRNGLQELNKALLDIDLDSEDIDHLILEARLPWSGQKFFDEELDQHYS